MEHSISDAPDHRGKIFVYKHPAGPVVPSKVIHASVDPSVKLIGKCAFEGCLQLDSIWIPEGVEIIGKYAFNGCSQLKTIDLPSTLKSIKPSAFRDCRNLVSVKFKEGLEMIGESAFDRCSKLETIDLPSTLKTIEPWAFNDSSNLVAVKFKEGLEFIGEGAFDGCLKLNTIDLPSTLKTIEPWAFKDCSNLVSVKFKEGLEIIGESAFFGCSQLSTIDLPSTLKTIEPWAFRDCSNLVSVKFKEGPEMIGKYAFKGCSQLETIDPPSTLKTIEPSAFKDCSNLVSVKFKEGLEFVGKEAFRKCSKLNVIDLPSTLKTIEPMAFNDCSNLVSVKFKEGLEIIGEGAFDGCSKLETIELPSTLKAIKPSAFRKWRNLVSVKLKEGLEMIGARAFYGFSQLETIDLPSTLKTIEPWAFRDCSNLVSVKFKEGLEFIGEGAFDGCLKLNTIDLPSTLKTIKPSAFKDCTDLVSVKFKEGLEFIGKEAFRKCSKLNTIDLPSTLKTIEPWAFKDCSNLVSVKFKESPGLEKLGSKSFAGCMNIETVILPANLDEIGDAFIDSKVISNAKFPPEIPKAKKEPIQKNTILHQLLDYKYPLPFIASFLKSCPSVIHERNTLGQTPLHLCITNQSGIEITKFVYNLWPDALHERNEIGKTPLDYWEEMGTDPQLHDVFSDGISLGKIPPSSAYFLKDGKWILLDNPELLRCLHIMLEVPESDEEILGLDDHSSETLRTYFHEQLYTRELLFGKLLDEFALLIEFDDKLVIQRAAAVQALCGSDYLSKCLKRQVDFGAFSSSALWYQQEILKLVLRVYHEDQSECSIQLHDLSAELYHPSAIDDAKNGQHSLENDEMNVPIHRKKSFVALLKWIVEEPALDDYTFEGPVLKPLQSLFNKIYIRRGQTKVSIVGDMTRATLHVKRKVDVVNIISKIKNKFPDIENFYSPDAIGVEGFMNHVFNLEKVPGTEIIPYRLKANSSQQGKELPLLYNLNFFDMLPEYHRVGSTEMFVAFELQIGLESEIKFNRAGHVAYERRRILKSQSLLKDYIEAKGDGKYSAESTLLPSSAIGANGRERDHDFKIMTAILEGNFSYNKLRALGDVELCGEDKKYLGKPDRLCLNNKRLNKWVGKGEACILDKVSSLDPSFQYCVKSLLICWNPSVLDFSSLYVGLFAYVGPYMVNVASRCIVYEYSKSETDIFIVKPQVTNFYIVKPQVNFETLERITPLPVGCSTVLLICWGDPCDFFKSKEWQQVRDENYKGMKLVLQKYERM